MTSILSIDAATATRSSSASAYLEPNLHRKNLMVLTEAQVTKVSAPSSSGPSDMQCRGADLPHQVLLADDGALQKASGVELVINGTTHRIENVKHDVVLSAGRADSISTLRESIARRSPSCAQVRSRRRSCLSCLESATRAFSRSTASPPAFTCLVSARTCVRGPSVSHRMTLPSASIELTTDSEDHIGVCTVAECETDDETPDVLTTPEIIKEHEEL